MPLTPAQKKQLELQLRNHRHKDYEVDIVLVDDHVLENFAVHSKVLRPELMSAYQLARWLVFNNGLYLNKTVIDMGCGSGIQGVVAGLHGAKKIIFSDLSPAAIANTRENVKRFRLGKKSFVVHGDLFQEIRQKADCIIFNHPFFHDHTIEELLEKSMFDRGKLIHRFFKEAKKYLKQGGCIIMPYFHLAGSVNDPAVQAPKNGYRVIERFRTHATSGLQKGPVSIYEIRLVK